MGSLPRGKRGFTNEGVGHRCRAGRAVRLAHGLRKAAWTSRVFERRLDRTVTSSRDTNPPQRGGMRGPAGLAFPAPIWALIDEQSASRVHRGFYDRGLRGFIHGSGTARRRRASIRPSDCRRPAADRPGRRPRCAGEEFVRLGTWPRISPASKSGHTSPTWRPQPTANLLVGADARNRQCAPSGAAPSDAEDLKIMCSLLADSGAICGGDGGSPQTVTAL